MAKETHQRISTAARQKAEAYNAKGLQHYEKWEIEEAIKSFGTATKTDSTNSDYYLNLARALVRSGEYEKALRAIGDFIRYEKDTQLVERFERLFSQAMDGVEKLITEKMTREGIPLDEIGAAITMWLEFRIAAGKRRISMRKPAGWAAALDYTTRKVNIRDVTQKEIAELYGVSDSTLRNSFNDLVETLDVMPCDYRYFRGDDNPLDKLVEAAAMLEKLEERFRRP
jgi:tetratricopeptide (TPR) repeat protein